MAQTIELINFNQPQFKSSPHLSLYVHIPWCVKKCPYCDFNSHEINKNSSEAFPEADYFKALLLDLESMLPMIWGRKIHSVFFGGGTPSLVSPEGLNQFLSDLRARLRFETYAEITLEANPATVEIEKFKAFSDSGINRISLGIQSFNDEHLKALGRVHDVKQAYSAIETAQRYFENINLDLMFGLPNQTQEGLQHELNTALSFGVQHLSCYQLTIEPQTAFYANPPVVPNDDILVAMQDQVIEQLAQQGYERYEISAYAKKNHQCVHNLNYWHFGDYLGIGAGSHGKITLHDKILRQDRIKQPQVYINKLLESFNYQSVLNDEHQVQKADVSFEFMMNALRLKQGFDPIIFEERTGFPIRIIEKQLNIAEQKGWIERSATIIKTTDLGYRYLNDILQLFLN